MAIVIGFGTTVGGVFSSACAINASWGYNPNIQRLYCIGETSPWKSIEKPTYTLSITVYQDSGGPGSTDISASISCDDLSYMEASVSPSTCGGSVASISSSSWHLNSYSYQKGDANLPGQETWSFTRWVDGSNSTDSPAPTNYIRNAAEGQSTESAGEAGISFTGTVLEGSSGSVSAGQTGTHDSTYHGMVSSVGSPSLTGGETGNGSATCNVTPLWI